jgi:DNA-binding response OmpR family regulator
MSDLGLSSKNNTILTILSIDDSKAVHAFLDRSLTGTPHKLIHAMDGIEGLEILKKNGSKISVILLDWEMPGLTGPEVLDKIRSFGSKVPVIMVTTKNDPSEMKKVLEAGAVEYIMKPFTPDILIEKIESVTQS